MSRTSLSAAFTVYFENHRHISKIIKTKIPVVINAGERYENSS